MIRSNKPTTRRPASRRGFSLIEVAMATAIVGVGVTALMTTIGAGTKTNRAGQEVTQASFLAQEMREHLLNTPLASLSSVTYTTPKDARGNDISGMPGWSQQVTVTWRNPTNVAATVTPGPTDVAYIRIDIVHNNATVLTTGWLAAKNTP